MTFMFLRFQTTELRLELFNGEQNKKKDRNQFCNWRTATDQLDWEVQK